jgi:hypothetical protein
MFNLESVVRVKPIFDEVGQSCAWPGELAKDDVTFTLLDRFPLDGILT